MADQIASMFAKVGADTSGFERGMSGIKNSINAFEQMSIGAFRRVGELAIDGIGKAMETVGDIVSSGIDFNAMQEQATVAFETMLGSADKAQSFLSEMQAFAKTTPFEYPDLLVASRRLMALGFEAEEVLPLLTNIGDAVAAMGGNQEMIDRVTTALGQMRAKGRVQAEEMMQLTENGIAGWDMLAKHLNVDVATAMEMVTKKQVDAATGIAAIQAGIASDFGGMMAKQSTTWEGLISNLKDSFGMLSGRVMKPFFDAVKDGLQWLVNFTSSEKFSKGIDKLVENIASGLDYLTDVAERFRNLFSFELAILTSANSSWGEKMIAVWDMVATVGGKIWTSLIKQLERLLPQWLAQLGEWGKQLWQWIVDNTPEALAKLGEWAKSLWGWIVENAPGWAANFVEWAKATWAWIVEVTPTVVQKMGELGLALVRAITAWAFSMGPEISALWNILVNIFTAAQGLLTGNWSMFWSNLENIVINFRQGILPTLQRWGEAIWQWIVEATPIALAKLGEWSRAIAGWVTANLPTWRTALVAWATAAWQWIVDVVPAVITALGTFGASIWNWIVANGPPIFAKLDEWGRNLWQWIEEAFGPVVTWLGNIAAEFLSWKDVVAGAILALGIIFWPVISGAFAAVIGAIGAFIAAWAPVIAIFVAAVAAVALLRNAWERDWGGIQTNTLAALQFIQDAFAPALEAVRLFGGDALKEIIAWATGNKTNFEATKKIIDAFQTAFTTVFTAIGAKLVEWGTLAWEWFKTNFPEAAAALMLAVGNIKRNFEELWIAAQPLIQKLKEAWAKFVEGAGGEANLFGTIMQRLKSLLDGVWTIMVTAAGFAINTIINLFTLVIQLIEGDWKEAWQTVKQIAKGAWDTLVTIVRTAIDKVAGLFGGSIEDVEAWIRRIKEKILGKKDDFERWGREIIQGLLNGIKDKWNDLTSWFSGVWDNLTDKFKKFFGIKSPSKVFAGYGEDMVAGLAKGIEGAKSLAVDAMGALSSSASVAMTPSYAYSLESNAESEDAILMRENNSLLRILIAELRNKNMTANVTIGGGGSYGSLVTHAAGMR